MNHSFFFCTWWPVVPRTTAVSGSDAISAPASSCVKYSPLWRWRYLPTNIINITNIKNNIANTLPKIAESVWLYACLTFSSSTIGGGLVSMMSGGCVIGSTPQKSSVIGAANKSLYQ